MPLPKGMKVVPKKRETREQAKARLEAKYGDPPAQNANAGSSSSSRRSKRPRSRSAPAIDSRTATANPVTPEGNSNSGPTTAEIGQPNTAAAFPYKEIVAPSGMKVTTSRYVDGIFSGRTNLMVLEWNQLTENLVNGAATTIFSNFNTYLLDVYVIMVQKLYGEKRFIPTQILGTLGDFITWKSNYDKAWISLRSLQSLIAAYSYNINTILGAQQVEIIRTRLDADVYRLSRIAMAPGWMTVLDCLSGVFVDTDSGLAILSTLNDTVVAGTTDNITTAAGIGAILTNAETHLASCYTVASAQPILEVLASLYPTPSLTPLGIHTDPVLFDQFEVAMAQFRDTTASTTFCVPSLASSSQIPILVRRGESGTYLLQPFRSTVYSVDNNVASPTMIGMLGWNPTGGMYAAMHAGTTGRIDANFQNPGAIAGLTAVSQTPGNELWFGRLAGEKQTITNDARGAYHWDWVYVTESFLFQEAIKMFSDIFVNGLDPLAAYKGK